MILYILNIYIHISSGLQCFDAVGWAASKKNRWGAGVVICLELGADLHVAQLMLLPLTVSCFSKIKIGFTFLLPAYPYFFQCFDAVGSVTGRASSL